MYNETSLVRDKTMHKDDREVLYVYREDNEKGKKKKKVVVKEEEVELEDPQAQMKASPSVPKKIKMEMIVTEVKRRWLKKKKTPPSSIPGTILEDDGEGEEN